MHSSVRVIFQTSDRDECGTLKDRHLNPITCHVFLCNKRLCVTDKSIRRKSCKRMLHQAMRVALGGLLIGCTWAIPYNTFDGDGFPACYNVSQIYQPTSVDEMVSLVQKAAKDGTPVRASGKGHMWY